MKTGSLCSGYEGFGLALNTEPAWVADIDPDAAKVLAHRFPDVPNLGDITAIDWHAVEPVDVLTAGYPCQPFSHAGKRKGSDDSRHIWPFVARAVGVLRPRVCFLENVAGHVSLGLADVLADLASLGYDATWGAADAGAPHGRARVFIAATDASGERHGRGQDSRSVGRVDRRDASETRERQRSRPVPVDRSVASLADAGHRRSQRQAGERLPERREPALRSDVSWDRYELAIRRWERALSRFAPRPTEHGRLAPRFVEWMMGLPDGWVCDVPGLSRNAQLKLLGNGIVPQQAALAWRVLNDLRAAA